jgi:hypothetical protein
MRLQNRTRAASAPHIILPISVVGIDVIILALSS